MQASCCATVQQVHHGGLAFASMNGLCKHEWPLQANWPMQAQLECHPAPVLCGAAAAPAPCRPTAAPAFMGRPRGTEHTMPRHAPGRPHVPAHDGESCAVCRMDASAADAAVGLHMMEPGCYVPAPMLHSAGACAPVESSRLCNQSMPQCQEAAACTSGIACLPALCARLMWPCR